MEDALKSAGFEQYVTIFQGQYFACLAPQFVNNVVKFQPTEYIVYIAIIWH